MTTSTRFKWINSRHNGCMEHNPNKGRGSLLFGRICLLEELRKCES